MANLLRSAGNIIGSGYSGVKRTWKNIQKEAVIGGLNLGLGIYESLDKDTQKNLQKKGLDYIKNKNNNSTNTTTTTKDDNVLPEQNIQDKGSGTADSSGSPKTSTVSNNKPNNTMQNNNTSAPVKQQSQQLQPDEYEQWRQRKTAAGDTYNQVFENAVNNFIANPDSFTQEQRNALVEMGNKLGYDLGGSSTPAPSAQRPSNEGYYSNQGDYGFRFSL